MSQYAKDGVNIEEETKFSSFAGSICKASYTNSPFVEVQDLSDGHFRGPRPFSLKNLPAGYMIEASSDGLGTKGILIDAAKTHHLAAYDIIAMTASDITRFGGIPLVFLNILDTAGVGPEGSETNEAYKNIIRGLGKVAKENKIVVLKGETAQVNDVVGSEIINSKTKFNWSGVMIGAYHKDKMITGEKLTAGQVIIALKEEGFRSNGGTAVRKALAQKFGKEWYANPDAQESIRQAATPSVLYDIFINTLHGWFNQNFEPELNIYSVVHLSGGGIKEKLAKDVLFPRGLSADLPNLWEPPQIMTDCATWHNIQDEEFYETWNGGQGMLIVVNEDKADYCIKKAAEFSIQAKVAGKITKTPSPKIVIQSQLTKGKQIVYE